MAVEPPILKLIERLRVEIALAVSRFPKAHRYSTGQQLRDEIAAAARVANRAWRDSAQARRWTEELVWAVDEFKQTLQVAKELKAFASFRQFEMLIRMADDLGRQCGGWKRQHRTDHSNGQNAPGLRAQGQRAQTLSTSAASPRGYA